MKFEKSCGAVVYRNYGDTIEYLTVRSKAFGHWGFPKGHVEEGESEEETARREVLEETGLYISLCKGFRTSIQYLSMKDTSKVVVFFAGKPLDGDVIIQQEEIQDYKWLNYSKTLELLTFDTDRKVLTEVNDFIA
jgi:bis(5'-nucleosidyl)-tetraphosphatase